MKKNNDLLPENMKMPVICFLIFAFGLAFFNHGNGVAGVIALFLVIVLYFLPSLIAARKESPSLSAIIVLNIFLGWTFIGWVIALIWACNNPSNILVQNVVKNENLYEQIEGLARLKEKGILTEEEFNEQKAKLLNNNEY